MDSVHNKKQTKFMNYIRPKKVGFLARAENGDWLFKFMYQDFVMQ